MGDSTSGDVLVNGGSEVGESGSCSGSSMCEWEDRGERSGAESMLRPRLLRFGVREAILDFRCAFELPRFGLGPWLFLFARRFVRA